MTKWRQARGQRLDTHYSMMGVNGSGTDEVSIQRNWTEIERKFNSLPFDFDKSDPSVSFTSSLTDWEANINLGTTSKVGNSWSRIGNMVFLHAWMVLATGVAWPSGTLGLSFGSDPTLPSALPIPFMPEGNYQTFGGDVWVFRPGSSRHYHVNARWHRLSTYNTGYPVLVFEMADGTPITNINPFNWDSGCQLNAVGWYHTY